jgi:hypothetical protein
MALALCVPYRKNKKAIAHKLIETMKQAMKGESMADEADRANDYAQLATEAAIRSNRKELQPGAPGDCELCGEWSGRLINGACAPCRDKYRLP